MNYEPFNLYNVVKGLSAIINELLAPLLKDVKSHAHISHRRNKRYILANKTGGDRNANHSDGFKTHRYE